MLSPSGEAAVGFEYTRFAEIDFTITTGGGTRNEYPHTMLGVQCWEMRMWDFLAHDTVQRVDSLEVFGCRWT